MPYQVRRRYLPDTNVLETTFVTDGGLVRVVDALNRDVDGMLPWTELAREVRAGMGEVPMRWRVAPGDRFHRARPWAWEHQGTPLFRIGDQMIAVVAEEAGEPQVGRAGVSGEFVARPGVDALLALAATDAEPAIVPAAAGIRERLRATEASWRRWSGTVSYHGPDRDLVLRSALALKLLTYAPTGGLLAALTTSLPERIGGDRNYDYRYGWIRDTSFAFDALLELGLQHEVHRILSWLLSAVSGTAPDIRPFYGMRGHVPAEGGTLEVRGYRDSRPAHDGNSAVSQSQWGNFGDMLESVWLAVDRGAAVLDPDTARMLEVIADRVCDLWAGPDSGIWELGSKRHYTSSKMACLVALDRMARLADRGQVSARDVARWRAEAAAIREKGAIAHANDLGLLPEEIDPASGELLGNMPQALSHLALLMAAHQLASG